MKRKKRLIGWMFSCELTMRNVGTGILGDREYTRVYKRKCHLPKKCIHFCHDKPCEAIKVEIKEKK